METGKSGRGGVQNERRGGYDLSTLYACMKVE
jgi:hypothetical protein